MSDYSFTHLPPADAVAHLDAFCSTLNKERDKIEALATTPGRREKSDLMAYAKLLNYLLTRPGYQNKLFAIRASSQSHGQPEKKLLLDLKKHDRNI